MIGNEVEMKFTLMIDESDEGQIKLRNAELFRLYELLKCTLEVHCHKGFHSAGSMCSNLSRPKL